MFTEKQKVIAMGLFWEIVAVFILSFWFGFYTVTYYSMFVGSMVMTVYSLACIIYNDRKEKEAKRAARRERYYSL